MNQLMLSAVVRSEEPIRYTPAGLPILEMWLQHESLCQAFAYEKRSFFDIQGVLIGAEALTCSGKLVNKLITLNGFLSQRSLKNPRLVLNIQSIEFEKVS